MKPQSHGGTSIEGSRVFKKRPRKNSSDRGGVEFGHHDEEMIPGRSLGSIILSEWLNAGNDRLLGREWGGEWWWIESGNGTARAREVA